MNIIKIYDSPSFVKARIPNNLQIKTATNHYLSIINIELNQTLPSSSSEKISILSDPKLLGLIIKGINT